MLQSPDIYKMYIEEFKDERMSTMDSAEIIRILLSYSINVSSLFEQYKVDILFMISLCLLVLSCA